MAPWAGVAGLGRGDSASPAAPIARSLAFDMNPLDKGPILDIDEYPSSDDERGGGSEGMTERLASYMSPGRARAGDIDDSASEHDPDVVEEVQFSRRGSGGGGGDDGDARLEAAMERATAARQQFESVSPATPPRRARALSPAFEAAYDSQLEATDHVPDSPRPSLDGPWVPGGGRAGGEDGGAALPEAERRLRAAVAAGEAAFAAKASECRRLEGLLAAAPLVDAGKLRAASAPRSSAKARPRPPTMPALGKPLSPTTALSRAIAPVGQAAAEGAARDAHRDWWVGEALASPLRVMGACGYGGDDDGAGDTTLHGAAPDWGAPRPSPR